MTRRVIRARLVVAIPLYKTQGRQGLVMIFIYYVCCSNLENSELVAFLLYAYCRPVHQTVWRRRMHSLPSHPVNLLGTIAGGHHAPLLLLSLDQRS